MPLTVTCSSCGHEYQVRDDSAGKKFRCRKCDAVVTAPSRKASSRRPADEDEDDSEDYEDYHPATRKPAGRRSRRTTRPGMNLPIGKIVAGLGAVATVLIVGGLIWGFATGKFPPRARPFDTLSDMSPSGAGWSMKLAGKPQPRDGRAPTPDEPGSWQLTTSDGRSYVITRSAPLANADKESIATIDELNTSEATFKQSLADTGKQPTERREKTLSGVVATEFLFAGPSTGQIRRTRIGKYEWAVEISHIQGAPAFMDQDYEAFFGSFRVADFAKPTSLRIPGASSTTLTIPPEFAQWKPVVIAPGICEIHMPGAPKHSTQTFTGEWHYQGNGFSMRVIKTLDKRAPTQTADVKDASEIVPSTFSWASGAELLFAGKYQGYETRFRQPGSPRDGILIQRAYDVDGDTVIIKFEVATEESFKAEAEFFFASLKLGKVYDPNGSAPHANTITDPFHSWTSFSVPDTNPAVVVHFPGQPKETAFIPGLKAWHADLGDGECFIAISEFDHSPDTVAAASERVHQTMIAPQRGVLESDRPIQLGPYQGFELVQQVPGSTSRGTTRVYRLPTRLLAVVWVGPKHPDSELRLKHFLDSLTIGGSSITSPSGGGAIAQGGIGSSHFLDRRRSFKTKLTKTGPAPQEFERETPPAGVRQVSYQSGNLQLAAWFAVPPGKENSKSPVCVFFHGGHAFGAGDFEVCRPLLNAGFAVMTPMLRGENGNPGSFELFFGELDDAVGAVRWVAQQPEIDATKIFTFGHSIGGGVSALVSLAERDVPVLLSGSSGGLYDECGTGFVNVLRWIGEACELRHKRENRSGFGCEIARTLPTGRCRSSCLLAVVRPLRRRTRSRISPCLSLGSSIPSSSIPCGCS
jgi:acetyl esterase/lipase